MTDRLRTFARPHLWLAASEYNRRDLADHGIDERKCAVAAPFNRAHQLLRTPPQRSYVGGTINLLFVGRMAPNKGHVRLVRLVQTLAVEFGRDVKLRIVGSIDPELSGYRTRLSKAINSAELHEEAVQISPHCSDADLQEFFQAAHFFVCFSEHEGFGVPLIESQALGLPVIAAGVAAVPETLGGGQLIDRLPESEEDYFFYARLIVEAFENVALREQVIRTGERNVLNRFASEPVENAFTAAVYQLLNGR